MKLYLRTIYYLVKAQLQYRASFAMMAIAQFIQPFALLFGIYFLFERFDSIKGWTRYEVFLCYALVGMCFSLAECAGRGFDKFPDMIRQGAFDRVLVRPRSAMFQVLAANFDLKRLGHFIQATLVLCFALSRAGIAFSGVKVLLLINMLIGGSLLFMGIYILQAAAAFYTIEGLEVANIFTHGIKEHASYPLNIFPRWITFIFTFIIPYGTINYLPLLYLLDKRGGSGLLYALIPLCGALFLLPAMAAWRLGARKYASAGS